MGICPLKAEGEEGGMLEVVVIPFDGAVQAGVRSIVGHAWIPISGHPRLVVSVWQTELQFTRVWQLRADRLNRFVRRSVGGRPVRTIEYAQRRNAGKP
jgi:hypothetical protein